MVIKGEKVEGEKREKRCQVPFRSKGKSGRIPSWAGPGKGA
jgi:hypothetical protein